MVFQIVRVQRKQYVVVAEARAIGLDGIPGMLQTSSMSTWRLTMQSKLKLVQFKVFAV